MRNDISLIFDIDDTLYSQMAPLLEACEESLGGRLADPEHFLPGLWRKEVRKCSCSVKVDRYLSISPVSIALRIP